MFKSVYSLQKERMFIKNIEFAISYFNIIKPLRNWIKIYRFKKFLSSKQWIFKKKMFREWKLIVVHQST